MVLKRCGLLFVAAMWISSLYEPLAHAQNKTQASAKGRPQMSKSMSKPMSKSQRKSNRTPALRGPASQSSVSSKARPQKPPARTNQTSRRSTPRGQVAFEQAQKLFNDEKYSQAFQLLEKSYPLNSKRVPTVVINLAIEASLKAGNVGHAETLSRSALYNKISWWPKYVSAADRESIDLSESLDKTSNHILKLIWLNGETQSILYSDFYKKLSKEDRQRLKSESRATYDALLQSSFDSELTEKIFNRVAATDAYEARRPYSFRRSLTAKFISWSDEFDYTFQNDQHSIGDVVSRAMCLGGNISYESLIWQFELAGCFALGKTSMALNTGFHSNVDTRAVQLGIGVYRRLNNLRIDIGTDVLVFSRFFSLGDVASESEPVSFTDITSFVVAPGIRMHFDRFSLSIKGGKTLGQASAIWMFEGAYKL